MQSHENEARHRKELNLQPTLAKLEGGDASRHAYGASWRPWLEHSGTPGGRTMTSRNLTRRVERLEEHLLPINEEPTVLRIILVSPDGQRVDSGIEFKVSATPKPFQKRRW